MSKNSVQWLKRFLIVMLIGLLCAYLLEWKVYHNQFNDEYISNSFFVVGAFMFFIGLVLLVNADRIFLVLIYSFRSLINRKNLPYKSYFDYAKDKEREHALPFIPQAFVTGIIFILIAVIYNYLYFHN